MVLSRNHKISARHVFSGRVRERSMHDLVAVMLQLLYKLLDCLLWNIIAEEVLWRIGFPLRGQLGKFGTKVGRPFQVRRSAMYFLFPGTINRNATVQVSHSMYGSKVSRLYGGPDRSELNNEALRAAPCAWHEENGGG